MDQQQLRMSRIILNLLNCRLCFDHFFVYLIFVFVKKLVFSSYNSLRQLNNNSHQKLASFKTKHIYLFTRQNFTLLLPQAYRSPSWDINMVPSPPHRTSVIQISSVFRETAKYKIYIFIVEISFEFKNTAKYMNIKPQYRNTLCLGKQLNIKKDIHSINICSRIKLII